MRNVAILELPKSPLIDNSGVACVVEQAWLYPWLCAGGDKSKNIRPEMRRWDMTHLDDEPTPKADTAHGLGTVRKSRGEGT